MLGTVIEAVGIGMLAWALYNETNSIIYGMMALVGAGAGMRFLCGMRASNFGAGSNSQC